MQYNNFSKLIKPRAESFLVIILAILVLAGLLILESISRFNEAIKLATNDQEKLIDRVTHDIYQNSFDPYLFKIKYFVEQNEGMREALADRNRNLLNQLCLPNFQYLQGENPFFFAMDFILPDGTVFLRVQEPLLFGDNISESRPIVADAHKNKASRWGFDVGKHGAIFWVAQPILHHGDYLGLVEFGIEAKQLEKALALLMDRDVTMVLKVKQKQKEELEKEGFQAYGNHVLMSRGDTPFDQIAGTIDMTYLENREVTLSGKPSILHRCVLLADFRKETLGWIVLLQDISEQVGLKRNFILNILLLIAALLSLVSYVIYNFYVLIGRMEAVAEENKIGKAELQLAHDQLEDRIKESIAELAKSNVKLVDEITIRGMAEARLDDQRSFLETIIESLTKPFYVIDAESYVVIMANKAARAIASDEFSHGLTCYQLTHHTERPCFSAGHPCPLTEVKKTGRPVVMEHVHYDPDERERNVEIHAYPVFDRNGKLSHVVEYLIDITERKKSKEEKDKLRSQLIAAQKMEAVGILAGGVAHDFNNILSIILGYSQIIAMKLEEMHPMRDMVNEIHDAAVRASGLTRQLLAYSRRQILEMTIVNLNSVVTNISKMLERLIGECVELRIATTEGVGNIKGDIGQLEQVIMNLVINARDAMPGGGSVTIETGQIDLDETYSSTRPEVEPGRYSMITVTDTGIGMSQEVLEQIFEPFFTTKKRGEGTGLGLSTVYGIVQQHDGHIYVYSEAGLGTTFKIYLPVVNASIEESSIGGHRTMPLGSETILVVDDDASIRHMVRDTLEPLGYEVIEAGSGEDALAVIERTGGPVHLVITDLIMPGMNGQQLLDALQDTGPEIKSILMSGYTNNILSGHNILRSEVIFINKPLLPIDLANKVREVLDATETRRPEKYTEENMGGECLLN